MVPIVVFASGRGSNFDAIYRATLEKKLSARIIGVLSDQIDAPVLEKARHAGIPTQSVPFPVSRPGFGIAERRVFHEMECLKTVRQWNPHFLVLAGYMKIVTSHLIDAFRSEHGYPRITNIHPSLLPAFPGLQGYGQAYRYGAKVAGATVHLVEEEVDRGPICAQAAFSIADCETERQVEERGLLIEHRLYPETLEWVLQEKFKLEYRSEGRPCVRQT